MGTEYMCHFSALHCIRRKKQHICVVHVHVMMRLLYHAYTAVGDVVPWLYSGYKKYDELL